MKKLSLLLAIWIVLALPIAVAETGAAIDPEFQADIIRLLQASKADGIVLQQAETVADDLIKPVKVVRTDISEERFVEIKQELMAFVKEELGGQEDIYGVLIPIYAAHYTHEEVVALADFYASPVGQKFLSVEPVIKQESRKAYESWSQLFLPMIALRLQQLLQD